jgi:hypothetical protein
MVNREWMKPKSFTGYDSFPLFPLISFVKPAVNGQIVKREWLMGQPFTIYEFRPHFSRILFVKPASFADTESILVLISSL